jgi:acyl carrier protein phosphodiesterase
MQQNDESQDLLFDYSNSIRTMANSPQSSLKNFDEETQKDIEYLIKEIPQEFKQVKIYLRNLQKFSDEWAGMRSRVLQAESHKAQEE